MPLSHLPPYVSALFYALAHCLDRRLQGRFPQLLIGVLFARGRRTCTAWFRAAGIADDFRQAYHAVHAAGRHADFLATRLLAVVRPLAPGPRLAVGIDDTPTPRWGACRPRGAGRASAARGRPTARSGWTWPSAPASGAAGSSWSACRTAGGCTRRSRRSWRRGGRPGAPSGWCWSTSPTAGGPTSAPTRP